MSANKPVHVFTYRNNTHSEMVLRVVIEGSYCDRPIAPVITGWDEDIGQRTWRPDIRYVHSPAASGDYREINAKMDAEARARRGLEATQWT